MTAALGPPRLMVCTICGLQGSWLCAHHIHAYGDDWAEGNRAACDFFHRRILRPVTEKLPDDYWGYEGEGF